MSSGVDSLVVLHHIVVVRINRAVPYANVWSLLVMLDGKLRPLIQPSALQAATSRWNNRFFLLNEHLCVWCMRLSHFLIIRTYQISCIVNRNFAHETIEFFFYMEMSLTGVTVDFSTSQLSTTPTT